MKTQKSKIVCTGRVEGGANQNTLRMMTERIEKPREDIREKGCVSNSEENKNKAIRGGVAKFTC